MSLVALKLIMLIAVVAMIWYLIWYEDLSPDFVNCEKCSSLVEVNWVLQIYRCDNCGFEKEVRRY